MAKPHFLSFSLSLAMRREKIIGRENFNTSILSSFR